MTERTRSNSSEASMRIIPMKKKAQATHIPLTKKWSSQGWDYIVDDEHNNDGDEFSQVVDPEDQGLLDNLWEHEKKKRAVYHPVASPYIFPTEDKPLRIYGSTYSAMNKDRKKCNTFGRGWNSSDDTTPDASDTRLLVEFSPDLENGKHHPTHNTDGQCIRKEDDYVIEINENDDSTQQEVYNGVHEKENYSNHPSIQTIKEENEEDNTGERRSKIVTSQESHSIDYPSENLIDQAFQEIQNIYQASSEHPRCLDYKIAIVDQCMNAIANISRKTYNDQIPMNTEIREKNMNIVDNTTMNEDDNIDSNDEKTSEQKSHNKISHEEKNQQIDDSNFHLTYSVEEKSKKMKKFKVQIKKEKGQRFFTPKKAKQILTKKTVGNENTNPRKRKFSNPTMSKTKKIRRFTAIKTQDIEQTDDKTKKSEVEKIFHKRSKKFVAVTPNSGYQRHENKKVMSIQTDVSFKINKKEKFKKIIITKEKQQDQTPKSTPPIRDAPFRNKSTQTAATEMKMTNKEDKKESDKDQQKSLTKKKQLQNRRKQKEPKRNVREKSEMQKPSTSKISSNITLPKKDDIQEVSDSDDEIGDPWFKTRFHNSIPKKQLPQRTRCFPRRFGTLLPSTEILDKVVIEGTEDEIRFYEEMKIKQKQEQKEMKRRKLLRRQMFADLTRTIGTQTKTNVICYEDPTANNSLQERHADNFTITEDTQDNPQDDSTMNAMNIANADISNSHMAQNVQNEFVPN